MGATIRADLDGSVHVTNGLGQRVVLVAGQPVPDGYQVGDHLLDKPSGGSGQTSDDLDAAYAGQQALVDGSIGDVLDRVGDDADKARAVLAAEHEVAGRSGRDARVGVVGKLEKLIADAEQGPPAS